MARKVVSNYLPEEMTICYFKMETGFKCLHWQNKQIEFDFMDKTVTPSKSEWEEFWDRLEEIGLWQWEADYERCCMVDGFEWKVKINKDGNCLESTGLNDGPMQLVGDEMLFVLDELLDAIEDLTGFRIDK